MASGALAALQRVAAGVAFVEVVATARVAIVVSGAAVGAERKHYLEGRITLAAYEGRKSGTRT